MHRFSKMSDGCIAAQMRMLCACGTTELRAGTMTASNPSRMPLLIWFDQTMPPGYIAQPARARPLWHWLGQLPGLGGAVAVDHQFREEHKIGLCRSHALTPDVDSGQHALRFAQKPIHTHGRHTGHLHRNIIVQASGAPTQTDKAYRFLAKNPTSKRASLRLRGFA